MRLNVNSCTHHVLAAPGRELLPPPDVKPLGRSTQDRGQTTGSSIDCEEPAEAKKQHVSWNQSVVILPQSALARFYKRYAQNATF